MRQKNIEKRRAVRSVLLYALLQLLSAALLLHIRSWFQTGWLRGLLLLLAAAGLCGLPFPFVVLRQRLREIDRGELEEARKY